MITESSELPAWVRRYPPHARSAVRDRSGPSFGLLEERRAAAQGDGEAAQRYIVGASFELERQMWQWAAGEHEHGLLARLIDLRRPRVVPSSDALGIGASALGAAFAARRPCTGPAPRLARRLFA